jgi:VWFA-related protein
MIEPRQRLPASDGRHGLFPTPPHHPAGDPPLTVRVISIDRYVGLPTMHVPQVLRRRRWPDDSLLDQPVMLPPDARLVGIRWALAALLLAGGSVLAAQTFRAGVDVVQLDVSVLDAARRPVLGLTAADFTVIVDGEARPIVAFDAISVPPPPPPPAAPWIRDIAPDVVTNDRPAGRVVVIMIDDGSLAQGQSDELGGLWAVQKTREIARAAVDSLGPGDLGAVLYTESNRTAQDFTTDRARLLTAIDRSVIFPGPSPVGGDPLLSDSIGIMRGSCTCGLCSIEALERVALALRALPQQRKTVLYISAGVPVALADVLRPEGGAHYLSLVLACNLRKRDAMIRVFRQAQLSNVTIQAIDPKGLIVGRPGFLDPSDPLAGLSTQRLEFLKTMAETTGGRAVVNNNDPQRQVPALFDETRSYYLLGVDSGVTADDGKLHRVQVQVNRPGVEVRTREGFYAPTARERREMAAAQPTRSLDEAIAGPLPKGDVPLDVAVAPFAEPGATRKAALAVVLGVTQELDPTRRRQARTEPIEVLSAAFHPETGKGQGERRQKLNVAFKATDSDTALFEVMSRLPVAPGRYQIRLGVRTADGKTGSVYTYAEVPDFGREPLTMSGLILSGEPAPRTAPPDAFKDLTPLLPTARRQFRPTDTVTAFARAYRDKSDAMVAALPRATTRITDASDSLVLEQSVDASLEDWRARGFADYYIPLGTAALQDGEYLLTLDVEAGPHSVRRAVRFLVKR